MGSWVKGESGGLGKGRVGCWVKGKGGELGKGVAGGVGYWENEIKSFCIAKV